MLNIHKSDINEIDRFDSPSSDMGVDHWTLYTLKDDTDQFITHCTGVAGMGWEFDKWQIIEKTKDNINEFKKILGCKNDLEKCIIACKVKGIQCAIAE